MFALHFFARAYFSLGWTVNVQEPASVCVFMQLHLPRLCQWEHFQEASPRTPCRASSIFPLIGGQLWAWRSGRSFNLYKNLHPSRPSHRREIKCFFTLVMSAQNDYLFWIIYSSARRNFLISPFLPLLLCRRQQMAVSLQKTYGSPFPSIN